MEISIIILEYCGVLYQMRVALCKIRHYETVNKLNL
jgi:hypothetical protein